MLKNIIKISKFAFSSLDKNPYTVLGLTPLASEEEIKMAYFKLAKLYHPDIDPKYAEKFKEINEAYQILKDPAKVKGKIFRDLSIRLHRESNKEITLIQALIKQIHIRIHMTNTGKISKAKIFIIDPMRVPSEDTRDIPEQSEHSMVLIQTIHFSTLTSR